MSSVASKLMNAPEFLDWVHREENRGKFFELERGEVIEMPPPTKFHGFVCGNVSRILGVFAANRRKGYVCTNDAGVIVEENPDTVRGPDISFYEDEQTAADMDRGYAVVPPTLSVDVLSPNERINRVAVRVAQLLNRGVKLVWVIDPEARDVCVYRPDHDPYVLTESDEMSGDEVLPDFRCRVSELFAMPGQPAKKEEPQEKK